MIFDPKKNNKIYDISPLVSSRSAVFPGDQAFSSKIALNYDRGDHLMLSSFETTCHIGSHGDAPRHYAADGKTIDQQDPKIYLGPCTVVDVSSFGLGRLAVESLFHLDLKTPRVLFKTGSLNSFDKWQDDFTSLSPELVSYLGENGVFLIGIDTPSVDPSKDPELKAHSMCYKNKISILENLDLREVPEGDYNLIALPLKLKDLEASPVRAILMS